jgi:hypothetical protein
MGNPATPAADLATVVDYVKASIVVTTPAVADQLVAHLGGAPRGGFVLTADAATD